MMFIAPHGPVTAPAPDSAPSSDTTGDDSRHLYFALLGERGLGTGRIDELTRCASRTFLTGKLDAAAKVEASFPPDLRSLPRWLEQGNRQTAQGYRRYLDERQAGGPRRHFKSRSHALNFIRTVAPTKLVDGAWLYGLLPLWQDRRLAPLIRIYLEELGDGVAEQNHVLLYQQLLGRYGCDRWQDGSNACFTQGAIQLALAHHGAEFLPELIGFNLGYEQLPLHLPITAYELNELDIDPYYFALHVTIDNASTGHARKSLQCLMDCVPRLGDPAEFHRRVANGYQLNEVGVGTNEAIAGFDLEREVLKVFADKAATGALLHSDYCRIGGRTVSDWLSSPGALPQFLAAMQSTGWIARGKAPESSRFWRLLTDAQAPMFGVFDAYEQQVIRDWICTDATAVPPARAVNRFRQRLGQPSRGRAAVSALPFHATLDELITHHVRDEEGCGRDSDGGLLLEHLAGVRTKPQALAVLQGMLSPSNHPTPAGLAATRLYADLFNR